MGGKEILSVLLNFLHVCMVFLRSVILSIVILSYKSVRGKNSKFLRT